MRCFILLLMRQLIGVGTVRGLSCLHLQCRRCESHDDILTVGGDKSFMDGFIDVGQRLGSARFLSLRKSNGLSMMTCVGPSYGWLPSG